jgi:hypothetical protein
MLSDPSLTGREYRVDTQLVSRQSTLAPRLSLSTSS